MSRAWPLMLLLVGGCTCKSREEKLKEAEDKGNLLAATKAKVVKGVGDALKNEGKQAAESVSEGTGEVVKGLGKGLEKSLNEVKLAVASELGGKGINATRASREPSGAKQHVVSVYVVLDKPYAGPLELRAYGADKKEIGRAKVQVDEKEATARYVDFEFDPRTPLLTADHFELR